MTSVFYLRPSGKRAGALRARGRDHPKARVDSSFADRPHEFVRPTVLGTTGWGQEGRGAREEGGGGCQVPGAVHPGPAREKRHFRVPSVEPEAFPTSGSGCTGRANRLLRFF